MIKTCVTRRTFLRVFAATLAGMVLDGCGATPTSTPVPTPTPATIKPKPTPVTVTPTVVPTIALPSATPITAKATAVPTAPKPKVQRLTIMSFTAWPAPTPRENNPYHQELEKRLGLRLDFNFIPSADEQAKLSATLASGDIPDCLGLAEWTPIVVQAAQAGAFLKLDLIGLPKETRGLPGLTVIKQSTWENSALNGEHYAVPNQSYEFGFCNVMRKDWLDKLGLAVPQTITDLKEVLKAFAKKDPDGNSRADTWGWGICQGRPWAQGGWHLFYWPFGVPFKYGLTKDGQIIHADVTEQMRAAVTFMRQVYETGALSPDFPAVPFAQVRDEFAAGRSGGLFGAIAAIYDSPQYGAALRKVVPTAELFAPDPVKADGFNRVTYRTAGYVRFTLINGKYAKDPEAAWDIMRVISFWQDPANERFILYGLEGIHHTIGPDGTPVLTQKGTDDIQWIRSWGPRPTETYQTANYVTPNTYKNKIIPDSDRLLKFAIGDPTWGLWPDLGTDNPEVELAKFATATFEQMIQGKKPLSDWDDYVTEWYKRGGQRLLDGWNRAKQKAGR